MEKWYYIILFTTFIIIVVESQFLSSWFHTNVGLLLGVPVIIGLSGTEPAYSQKSVH